MIIDKDKLLAFISKDSTLTLNLPRFEVRVEQQNMLLNVVEAFNQKKIALIEAGTGVGKSFAYLIPALYFSHVHQEKVVISTHTIPLQEQLFFKDIPLLMKSLGFDLKISLAVGMGNYLCKLKCSGDLLASSDMKEKLVQFAQSETDGKRSSLPFSCSQTDWEEVAVDFDSCMGMKCPHYQSCFFFKDRKKNSESQIIVANHHLLLSDLLIKKKTENSPLSSYGHVIIDEAHHLEAVATKLFADQLSMRDSFKLLNRLITEGVKGKRGRVNLYTDLFPDLVVRHVELAADKKVLAQIYHDFFEVLSLFLGPHGKKRLTEQSRAEPLFMEGVVTKAHQVLLEGRRFCQNVKAFNIHVKSQEETLKKRAEPILVEIQLLLQRLNEGLDLIENVIVNMQNQGFVAWVEGDEKEVKVINAPIDVSSGLKQYLFEPMRTAVLLSATLATQNQFSFVKRRLGIEEPAIEAIYPSPFNYKEQALMVIPKDLPTPDHISFLSQAKEMILDCVEASQGRAFILFTSHSSMMHTYGELFLILKERRFELFRQGDASRRDLIEQFKKAKRGILFGTDSFWEGVDIAGDQLSAVILFKLPFAAPNDPMIEAQAELCQKLGQSPFFDYHLPKAIVKFKQGFGRLIRHTKDRGVVLCLDSRIVVKNYGKAFLKSLPDCEVKITEKGGHKRLLERFFKGNGA